MKSRLNVGIRCTSVSEICVEMPCRVGAKSGVASPYTGWAASSMACATNCGSTLVCSERLTTMPSRVNGWNPMARTATVYGPPTSRPWIRYWPLLRLRTVVVKPLPRFVTCTAASATGWPLASVTFPEIAPVVTPWANAAPGWNSETTANAPRARQDRTIQRMDEPLLRGNECWVLVTIETGRKSPGLASASRTLGRRFTQQIHGRDTDEKIRRPRREHRRQHTARADRLRQLKHQQHDEGGRQTRGDAPGRAALGARDGERRAEQRDQQADERNRDLERELHLQLLGIRAAARQRVDVAAQLAVAHFVRPLGLGEKIHRPLAQRARLQRVELEGGLAARLVPREVAQRAVMQRPAGRARLHGVAVDGALGREHNGGIRQADTFALQHHVRHLLRAQLERADRVDPAAVGTIHEVVARAGGANRFLPQHFQPV